MKRTISLALVLMLLLGAFAGCGSDPAETTASAEVTDTTAAETETETLYEPDDLPADLRYDGETINTFGWSGAYGTHFWIDPEREIIAIYMKNSRYDGGSGAVTARNFEKDVYASLA